MKALKIQVQEKLEGATFEELVEIWNDFTAATYNATIESSIMDQMEKVDEEKFLKWANEA